MKILIGMPDKDSWGGPAASEPPFVDELKNLGIKVATETYVYGDKQSSASFLRRAVRVVKTALRFRRRLANEEFDVVHLNTAFDKKTVLRDAVSILLMRPGKAKVFLKIHGAGAHLISPNSFVYSRLIRFLDKRVAAYGIFTREELETFQPHGIDPAKFHFIKNIVELAPNTHSSPQKPRSGTVDLLFVSRFIETKGLLESISAMSLLNEDGMKYRLFCVGDGPIRDQAKSLVKELALDEVVTFTGYIPETEVEKYLRASDIFVFPTRHTEGFPIALFKAAAAGMPIVTTKVRAAAEYLREPDNCLFCNSDPADIAAQIARIAANEDLRSKMSEENYKLGLTLSAEAVTAAYVEVFRDMLNN